MHSRYHLCFAASSRKRPQAVPAHGSAVTGAPGARLLGMKTIPFGRRLRGVFAACLPPPFTGRGLSLRRVWRVLGLFIAVREVFYQRIPLLSTKIVPASASGLTKRQTFFIRFPTGLQENSPLSLPNRFFDFLPSFPSPPAPCFWAYKKAEGNSLRPDGVTPEGPEARKPGPAPDACAGSWWWSRGHPPTGSGGGRFHCPGSAPERNGSAEYKGARQ